MKNRNIRLVVPENLDLTSLNILQYTCVVCVYSYTVHYRGKMRPGIAFSSKCDASQQVELLKSRFTKKGFSRRGFQFAVEFLSDNGYISKIEKHRNFKEFSEFNRGALYQVAEGPVRNIVLMGLDKKVLGSFYKMFEKKEEKSLNSVSEEMQEQANVRAGIMRAYGKFIPVIGFGMTYQQYERIITIYKEWIETNKDFVFPFLKSLEIPLQKAA